MLLINVPGHRLSPSLQRSPSFLDYGILLLARIFILNASSSLSTPSNAVFRVKVITLILYNAGEMGSYFLVEPPYQSALEDIRRLYPQLSFSQNFITDPTWILQCLYLMPVSDDTLAKFYYFHESRWRKANLTVFITTTQVGRSVHVDVCGF